MAKSKSGARQPLSRVKPGVAKKATRVKAVSRDAKRATRDAGKSRPASRVPRAAPPAKLYAALHTLYPDAHCELDFKNPYQLLVATILSAQCTDKRVNMVTPALFAKYPDARALASAKQEELEEMIKSTGFFRNKAKSLLGMAAAVVDKHGGEIPSDMQSLVALPGVGRKTANVILGNAFSMNEGVVVDTHVTRLAGRLGLTKETDAVKIENALMKVFPQDDWTMLSHLLIFHGRRICDAKAPKCGECALVTMCPSARV